MHPPNAYPINDIRQTPLATYNTTQRIKKGQTRILELTNHYA